MDGDGAFICSGGLLNTMGGASVPYLLTANHCFSTQASATSLEAFWQYRTAFCGAGIPNENNFPSTLGSTLLATAAKPLSDFTFVQLSQDPPDDSVLLGWTTANVTFADNLMLYRLSYANGDPMIFTREQVSAVPSPDVCSDAPQSNFIYTKDIQGASGGGSSGSPEYLEDLRVIGQEYGQCGENSDDCDVTNNSTIDGAFRVTFPSIRQWLEPGNPGPCVANATTLCLNAARFRVTVSYSTAQGSSAASGAGMAVPLTADSGYFWFFDASNIELIVKVLDACSISQHFWVFAGGLTNVGVTIIVEDTVTGASQVYTNPVGTAFQPLQDTAAFTCP
jgi:lysyl endopeptidase